MFRLSDHSNMPKINLSFLHLLRLTSNFKTTDPRDAVFALLGLTTKDHNPETAPFIEADYSLNPWAVWSIVTEKFLCHSGQLPLEFLGSAEWWPRNVHTDRFPGPNPVNFPSWVPNWAFRFNSVLSPVSLGGGFRPAGSHQYERIPQQHPRLLTVKAFEVSTVLYCAVIMRKAEPKGAVEMLANGQAFGTLSPILLSIFAQTLSAGRDAYGSRERDRTAILRHYAAYLRRHHPNVSQGRKDQALPRSFESNLKRFRGRQFLRRTRYANNLQEDISKSSAIFESSEMKLLEHAAQHGDSATFESIAEQVCCNRRLFVTTDGHLGLGPWQMQPGDVVAVLGGADMPFIVRPRTQGCFFSMLVGECYIDDIMDGEVVEAAREGKRQKGPFHLRNLLAGLFDFGCVSSASISRLKEVKEVVTMAAEAVGPITEVVFDLG